MSMKPLEIRRKEFARSFRGYNAEQVEDFLETVADEYERIYTENLKINEEISNVRERLEQFEELEGSIREALVHAEKAAGDLRESARREAESMRMNATREAELTVREAKSRANQILADSSEKIERARESYEALKEAKEKFASDFRRLLRSYLEVMDNAEIASAKEVEASLRERLDPEALAAAREALRENQEGEQEKPELDEEDTRLMHASELESAPEAEETEAETSSAEAAGEVGQEESAEELEEDSKGSASGEEHKDEPVSESGRFWRRNE